MEDDLELKKQITQLEQLVETRTSALTEARTQLEQAIIEREQVEAKQVRLLETERAQAQRRAALLRLSAELTAALDESEVCWCVVRGLRETLDYSNVALTLLDEITGDRIMAAHVGFEEYLSEIPTRIKPGQGLSELPLLDGQLHYTPDVKQNSRYYLGAGGSEVDVPIQFGGKVLGALTAESRLVDAFSQDDFEVLTAAAQQTSLAIEKARLLAGERKRADELDALRTTMAEITTELELSSLLQAIVKRAAGLLNATGGELGLYDEANQEVRIVVSHNVGEGYVGTRHAHGEGVMGRVAETRESLIIEDYHTWESRAPQYADVQMHASLAAPLIVGSRLVGVITIATIDPDRQFCSNDLHLLNLFAQQAAIAIENARLFGEIERRATEMATLTEVGKTLSSTLRVDEILQLIYEQTGRVMYGENMLIAFYDEANNELECTFSTNPEDIPVGARFPAGTGLGWYIIKHNQSLLLRNNVVERAHELGVEPIGIPAALWLGVPMRRGERVLGGIAIQHYSIPNVYNESHQVLLETIASQGAIAIENARLYDQAQREIAERERAEAELRKYQEHLEERVDERTAELQESEERYRTLFDGVPVGLYRTTPAGQIVDANLAFVEMLGYSSREDLQTISSASFYVDPEDRARWQALMEQEGVVRDFEVQNRRQNGTVIWVKETARAVKNEKGQVLYYEGSLEDITERKRAEEELRKYREHLEELVEERTAELSESEERYRTLFDGVPVGLYRSTPAGQFLDVNQAFVQMAGYPNRETILKVNTSKFYMDPKEQIRWRALMEREGVVRDFEVQHRRYDGTHMWISEAARAVKDERGKVLYYEGSIEDITERKRFEEEIRRQKEYFEALFVIIPVAALTADNDAKIVSWNPMAEKLFGYTQEEAIGQHVDDLVATDPGIREEAHGYTQQVLAQEPVMAVTKRTRKDGSFVDVEVRGLPVMVSGEFGGYIAIYHDVSELQQARRTAEAANQAKSAFLANMSHELRTPLNAILGFSQLMENDPNLTADQHENLRVINRSGEHLLALINDVLEMSKIEAGRVTLQEKSFDLYCLLDTLEEMFQLRAEGKGLALNFQRTDDVPRYLEMDEGKLRQVLTNLLGNAIKFTEEGGVVLQVVKAIEEERLFFTVEDSGPGIAPEELETVFEPFVQTANLERSQEGTGLGLSISRQFARLMGGDITVSSEFGQGSVFRFEVPITVVDAATFEVAKPSRRVVGLKPGQAGYRLLIVDDIKTTRHLLVKLLAPLGFELREAVNGREAIAIWECWEPHLIWMDMRMPVMNGYEATRQIKASARGQSTLIVALTASAFEEDREMILSAGCDDIVRKPFRKEEIFDKLAKYLEVCFVYDEEPVQPTKTLVAETRDVLTPAALADLPPDWVTELQQSTLKADLNQILALSDQIRGQNVELADALADLAQNFEYKKILSLIEQAGGER